MAVFCSLFSGSSGNCEYIGYNGNGILIDAGVSAKRIILALEDNQIDPGNILGIFVTHEHTDHIKGLRVFAKKYSIPVFCSHGTMMALQTDDKTLNELTITPFQNKVIIDGFIIERFDTSHDCEGSSGYRITTPDNRVAAICTDLGYISDSVKNSLCGCSLVMIESNHDASMLRNGPYPYSLKQRIASDKGHLSNTCCADILPELVSCGTTKIILGHLSKENNLPKTAYDCAVSFLALKGYQPDVDYYLQVASPEGGRMIVI